MIHPAYIDTKSGMGGFLNPPGHPEHTSHVSSVSKITNWFSISLSSAVNCDWITPAIRTEAKRKLKEWSDNRPALESEEVQNWVLRVLGYFHDTYISPNGFVANEGYDIHLNWDPMEHIDEHAGVACIRKFYPKFVPTEKHFKNAYWGTKPEAVTA